MCVEIIKPEHNVSFKPELPLEEQISGSKEVIIDCEPDCPKVIKFLDEVEKACKYGKTLGIKLKMVGNNLNLFSKTAKLNKELATNDIISKMALIYDRADKGLAEISNMCKKGNCE
jgi:hypothetical protein